MSQAFAEAARATTASQTALDVSERRLRQGATTALVLGLLALLVLVAVAGWLYRRNVANNAWVDHTYAAQAKINALSTIAERLETARRGYLLTPGETYWRTYVEARGLIRPSLDDLAEFTGDNPRQQRNVSSLRGLVDAKLKDMAATIEAAHDGDRYGALQYFMTHQDQELTQRMRGVLAAMLTEESRLLDLRGRLKRGDARLLLGVIIVTALLVSLLAVGAVYLMRRYAADLARSQAALRSLNSGLEGAVRDRTADLTRANDEIQRFAYIVSHDLRSPLVNVMGFTSELEESLGALRRQISTLDEADPGLVVKETRTAVEQDIPESIDFIRTSTKKMDRLINAILRLSREGRRTLNPEALDMDAMGRGIADSLAKLAEDKQAQITVEPRMPTLVSDRLAVEQVLSNLVENAVKYLKPNAPGRVVLRGAVTGGRVVFEVEDDGRGIAPQDHERIFELFRRSGAQDQPGEGIGLAHVRALVYRLGGTIACVSELGRGSTFRVSLPPRIMADEGRSAA